MQLNGVFRAANARGPHTYIHRKRGKSMNSDALVTIQDEELEAVAGGGIGAAIGGAIDSLLGGAFNLLGGGLSAIGGLLSGVGDWLSS